MRWDAPAIAGGSEDAVSSSYHTAHQSAWTDGGEQGGRFPGHQLLRASCIPPKHKANPADCSLLHARSFSGPQEPKHLSARRVWAKQNRQSLPLNSNENAQHGLWEEGTNHLPKEFTSIVSISSCPEAAGCSHASRHRLGAARSAGVRRRTLPRSVGADRGSRPLARCLRPGGWGGIYRCPGITSFPRQLGSEQTHSTAQKGAGGYNQLTPRLLQSHQLLLQEKAY